LWRFPPPLSVFVSQAPPPPSEPPLFWHCGIETPFSFRTGFFFFELSPPKRGVLCSLYIIPPPLWQNTLFVDHCCLLLDTSKADPFFRNLLPPPLISVEFPQGEPIFVCSFGEKPPPPQMIPPLKHRSILLVSLWAPLRKPSFIYPRFSSRNGWLPSMWFSSSLIPHVSIFVYYHSLASLPPPFQYFLHLLSFLPPLTVSR